MADVLEAAHRVAHRLVQVPQLQVDVRGVVQVVAVLALALQLQADALGAAQAVVARVQDLQLQAVVLLVEIVVLRDVKKVANLYVV